MSIQHVREGARTGEGVVMVRVQPGPIDVADGGVARQVGAHAIPVPRTGRFMISGMRVRRTRLACDRADSRPLTGDCAGLRHRRSALSWRAATGPRRRDDADT